MAKYYRLLFVHKAESLGQIFGVLLAARTVEVKPVEVNLVRTLAAVRLAAVEQCYFASCASAVIPSVRMQSEPLLM